MVTDIRRLKKMSTNSEDVLKEATLTARFERYTPLVMESLVLTEHTKH